MKNAVVNLNNYDNINFPTGIRPKNSLRCPYLAETHCDTLLGIPKSNRNVKVVHANGIRGFGATEKLFEVEFFAFGY